MIIVAILFAAVIIVGTLIGLHIASSPPEMDEVKQAGCSLRGGDYVLEGDNWICEGADF